ncbi:DUF192 domain-containing protein [Acidobacteria bacterium AB60]|nr:DUF192 domain-containing protein [Acidobacteria bacterium AB60]
MTSKPSSIVRTLCKFLRGRAHVPAHVRIINLTQQTEIADRAEVADRGERRRKGLLGRAGLASGEGLWIVPCEAVHTFGMQFAIDLVYLDRNKRVLKTRSGLKPGRLSACLSAHSVLELSSGAVRSTGTKRGDVLEIAQAPVSE